MSITVETGRGDTDKLGAEPVGLVWSTRFGTHWKKLPYDSKPRDYRPQSYIHYYSGTSRIFSKLYGLRMNQ